MVILELAVIKFTNGPRHLTSISDGGLVRFREPLSDHPTSPSSGTSIFIAHVAHFPRGITTILDIDVRQEGDGGDEGRQGGYLGEIFAR